jgi:hypothetical protein
MQFNIQKGRPYPTKVVDDKYIPFLPEKPKLIVKEYEQSPSISTFQTQFRTLRDRLLSLPEASFQNPIMLRRGSEIIESSALREIYAAAFHSIHHFAIMSAILREIMGPEKAEKYIPSKFGFKPKTEGRARL